MPQYQMLVDTVMERRMDEIDLEGGGTGGGWSPLFPHILPIPLEEHPSVIGQD